MEDDMAYRRVTKEPDRRLIEDGINNLLLDGLPVKEPERSLELRRRLRWAQDFVTPMAFANKADLLTEVAELEGKWEARRVVRIGDYEITTDAYPQEQVVNLERLHAALTAAGVDAEAVLASCLCVTTGKRLVVKRVGEGTWSPLPLARVVEAKPKEARGAPPDEEWHKLVNWMEEQPIDRFPADFSWPALSRRWDAGEWATWQHARTALEREYPVVVDPFS